MSKYGLHSGKGKFKDLVVDGRHVPNMLLLRKADLDGTNVSGVAAAAKSAGSNIPIPAYAFGDDHAGDVSVSFSTVVPSNIPEDTRADIRLYWTISGAASDIGGGTDVVWDVNYRSTSVIKSGALVANRNYVISGNMARATTTGKYVGGTATSGQPHFLSGAVVETVVTIPSSAFRGGDILQGMIKRNSYSGVWTAGDTLATEVYLIYAIVEYV